MTIKRAPRPKNTRESIKERTVRDENGCLLWQGHTFKKGYRRGYGTVNFEGKLWSVHRLFYTWAKGDIPPGFHVDHLCNVRNCVESAHLEAVTPSQNSIRAGERREECRNGHPYSLYRKRVSTTGESYCSACVDANNERYRRERGIPARGTAEMCKRGHPFDGRVDSRGNRYCQVCRTEWRRAARARK